MAGSSTTSYTVHSRDGHKVFGFLKTAREFAQKKANDTGVSVGIYQNGGKGRAKSWTVTPKRSNPLFSFKRYYVSCDGKKFGPYLTKAKANSVAVKIARVLDKPAKILGQAKAAANPKRKRPVKRAKRTTTKRRTVKRTTRRRR